MERSRPLPRRTAPLAILLCLLGGLVATSPRPAAAARGGDPDWPCRQRLVPTIAAGAFWSGPAAAGDWRNAPAVADLVRRIAPRHVAEAEGVAAIEAFAAGLEPAERERLVPLAFAGLLEETGRQRGELIAHIKRFARRQHAVAEVVTQLTAELGAIPADAQGEAAARRADLEQRRFFTTKAFEDAERTVRYACETPVALEARLGAWARALQAALPR